VCRVNLAAGVERKERRGGAELVLPSGAEPRPGSGAEPRPIDEGQGDLPPQSDALALGRLVRRVEHWRLFPELQAEARYIDIETTGLAPTDPITVVGVSDGHGTTVLVRGRGLSARALREVLADARLLVTFNGTTFDLPRLRASFPHLPWDLPHFDLALEGRQVGLSGGLKAIEATLGRRRPRGLQGITGAAAAALWRDHEAGDEEALRRLVRYCRADVESLVALAPAIHARLAAAGQAPGIILPS
jgi:uncharacterized protein